VSLVLSAGRRISGHDFVRAMMHEGYRRIGTNRSRAVLAKGFSTLIVPEDEDLSDEMLGALLSAAKVDRPRFTELLQRIERSEPRSSGAMPVAGTEPPMASRKP
jgi:hypothetical protein